MEAQIPTKMSTKVWPGPLYWSTWFLLCLVSFREQYTYGGSDTDKDVYQGLAWAFVLIYLVPTLPGKFQRAVYLWRLRYRQQMSTKVWPGPLCWTTWFLPYLVSFREQYTYGGSDTGNWCLTTDAWAFALNYLVPTLPGKFQRAVYLWRLRYRQQMSTKVWPGPLYWSTWFLLCLVSFREQYTYGGSDTDNRCLPRSGLGHCVELPVFYSAW